MSIRSERAKLRRSRPQDDGRGEAECLAAMQFRAENRFALFLELPGYMTQFRTENRFTLFLELLSRQSVGRASGERLAHPDLGKAGAVKGALSK